MGGGIEQQLICHQYAQVFSIHFGGTPCKNDLRMNKQREAILQKNCVRWFRFQFPKLKMLLVSSVNGAMLQGTPEQRAKSWKRLESEGAVPGVSDLFLFVARGGYHGLCIEMKVEGNTQSPKQKEWEALVTEQNYKYVVCKSFDSFQQIILDYVNS